MIADLLCTRLDRLVVVDLHSPAVEGFFTLPVEHLSAVPLLPEKLRPFQAEHQVIVAPDLGAVKLAQQYADALDANVAYVHKERLSGSKTAVRHVIGDVRGRIPVVADDMISTGGTIAATIEAFLERECASPVTVVASHGLFVGPAEKRLSSLPIEQVIVTDSLCRPPDMGLPLKTVSLKRTLAEAIVRLHE